MEVLVCRLYTRIMSHKCNWVENKSFKDGHSLLCKFSIVITLFLFNQTSKTGRQNGFTVRSHENAAEAHYMRCACNGQICSDNFILTIQFQESRQRQRNRKHHPFSLYYIIIKNPCGLNVLITKVHLL